MPKGIRLPDGTVLDITGLSPKEIDAKLAAAMARQQLPTPKAPTPRPPTTARQNFVNSAVDAAAPSLDLLGMIKALAHPIDTLTALQRAQDDQKQQFTADLEGLAKAPWDQKLNYALSGVQHGLGRLPIIGPLVSSAGDQVRYDQSGNLPAALAKGAGATVGNLAGLAVPAPGGKLGGAIKTLAGRTAPRIVELGLPALKAMREDFPDAAAYAAQRGTPITRRGQEALMDQTETQVNRAVGEYDRTRGGLVPPLQLGPGAPEYNVIEVPTGPYGAKTATTPAWNYVTERVPRHVAEASDVGTYVPDFTFENPVHGNLPEAQPPVVTRIDPRDPRALPDGRGTLPLVDPRGLNQVIAEIGEPQFLGESARAPIPGQPFTEATLFDVRPKPPAAPGPRLSGYAPSWMVAPEDLARTARDYVVHRGEFGPRRQSGGRGATKLDDYAKLDALEANFLEGNPNPYTMRDLLDTKRTEQGLASYTKRGNNVENNVRELYHQGTGAATRNALIDKLPGVESALKTEENLLALRKAHEARAQARSSTQHLVPVILAGSGFAGGQGSLGLAAATAYEVMRHPTMMSMLAQDVNFLGDMAPKVGKTAPLVGMTQSNAFEEQQKRLARMLFDR